MAESKMIRQAVPMMSGQLGCFNGTLVR